MATVLQFPVDVKVFDATLDTRPGFAYRDQAAAVWFVEEDGARWLLHDVDRPALVLNGQCALAEAQRTEDERFGSLYALVDYRQSHHARVAR
jgi:hypothetical protein